MHFVDHMVVVSRCRDDPVVVVWEKLYDISDGVEPPVDVQAGSDFERTGRHAASLYTIHSL